MNLDKISSWLFRKNLRGSSFFHKHVLKKRSLKVKTKHGILLNLNPDEYIDRFVINHGYYESEVLAAVLDYLPEDGVFWDVGANIGLHAVTVASKMPKVNVVCFEPNPLMTKKIRENSKNNDMTLKIIQIALGKKNEEKPLYLHPGNAGMSSIHKWNNEDKINKINVQIRRADNICPGEVEAPHVVKIDVEGNEYDVLQGMKRILDSKRTRAIIFEDNQEESPSKQMLQCKGFRITQLMRIEPSHHNLENYLAIKDN